ncbi:ribosomal RNA-processing 7 protein [Wolffia australiana]
MKKRKVKKLTTDSESSKKERRREKELDGNRGLELKTKKIIEKVLDADSPILRKKKKGKKKRVDDESDGSQTKRKKGAGKKQRAADEPSVRNGPLVELTAVDEDSSRGMKKWVMDYHQRRPGLDVIQQRISNFIASYEAEQEQAKRDREASAAEEGWTVVAHHKGRKKTTDSESGIAVGSISQAAAEARMSKKKEEVALDFYRFQKRESQRNELMMLQNKFEQDKKRLQQLRAARKFRPY